MEEIEEVLNIFDVTNTDASALLEKENVGPHSSSLVYYYMWLFDVMARS